MVEKDKVKYVCSKSSISNMNYKITLISTLIFYFIGQILVGMNKSYGTFKFYLPYSKNHIFGTSICEEELCMNNSPYVRDVSFIVCGGYLFTFIAQVIRLRVSFFTEKAGSNNNYV